MLGVVILTGLHFRLDGLAEQSFTNDELSALNRTQFDSYAEMLEKGVAMIDYHPAGVQSFQYAWKNLFGTSVLSTRLPFVLFGALSIVMVFLLGRQWSNERTGLIAAAFLATLAFPILYSRLARPYSPALFLLLLSAYLWTRSLRDTSWTNLTGFIVASVLTAWCHYYAAVMIGILGFVGILYLRGRDLMKYLLSGAGIVAIAALHWPITRAQLNNDGIGGPQGWLDAPEEGWLFDFIQYAFNGPLYFWIVISAAALGAWYMFERKASWRPVVLFVFIALSHYYFGYFYSTEIQPILQYSGMLFSFPFLILAASYLIEKVPVPTVILLPLIVLISSSITTNHFADPRGNEQFGKFKELALAFDEWQNEYGNAVSFTANVNDPYYLEYYLKNNIELKVDRIKEREELRQLTEFLKGSKSEYLAFCWSTIQMPAVVYPLIQEYFPVIVDDRRYFNSQVTLFTRATGPDAPREKQVEIPVAMNLPSKADSDIRFLENEFSPSIRLTAQELREKSGMEYPLVVFRVNLRAAPGSNPVLVNEWKRKGTSYLWRGSELNEFHPSGTWETLLSAEHLPKGAWMDDELSLYIWNRGTSRVEIAEIEVFVESEN